ncbi:ankyrin repeat and MYND domain-containing protein 2 [Condylostylus longicornis]|uniref:ankyrin repeat and MYND domain-containing protein 2 n=1 Tax=Condylostylus longicornis TaxID=2530218 RepID=UPI00244DDBCF|nr:ankyrin repeat and MYND domain-containing protein 2 [Condylostylus longicornis]
MVNEVVLNEFQSKIFEKISKNEVDDFKALLAVCKDTVNFVDKNGMTPLQHACYKGNKEIVQMLLDQGADVNYSQHGAGYTSLHFAALSGNTDVCVLLLDAGVNANTLNSVSRTAAQMAAFVGNHQCVATINNHISKSEIECYTKLQGHQTEPYLQPILLDNFHRFVIQINIHPVRVALNLQKYSLSDHLKSVNKVLELMMEKEMQKKYDVNELMAYKYHYLSWIVKEIMRCQEHFQNAKKDNKTDSSNEGKHDFIELFAKRVLKENKLGQLDYLEYTIRDCAREFPYRECTIFRQVVSQLANKDSLPALDILKNAINGSRGFVDDITFCSSCGEEKPDKKCSKCKQVQYCDRECQRLHWFMHKKNCARPTSASASASGSQSAKKDIDANDIREQLQNLVAS